MIKKCTPCFISTSGHYNFFYPQYNEEGLTYFEEDVDTYNIQPWVCGKPELAAIVVDAKDIENLYGSSQTVVWVEKKHLKGI